MEHITEVRRLRKVGASLYLAIPEKQLARLRWSNGDIIVLRSGEGKLILERVPVEQLARIRAEQSDAVALEKP